MFEWTKSVRAVSAVCFVLGIHIGLLTGKIPVELYMPVAMIVIGAYFARRDTSQERGK